MEKTQKTVIILTYCRVHVETGKPGKPGRYWFLEKVREILESQRILW